MKNNKKTKNIPENIQNNAPKPEIILSTIPDIKIGCGRSGIKDKIGYYIASVLNSLLILFVFIDPYTTIDKLNIHSFYLIPIILLAVAVFGTIFIFKKKFLLGLIPVVLIVGKLYADYILGKDTPFSDNISILYLNFFVLSAAVCLFNIESPAFIMESLLVTVFSVSFIFYGYEFSFISYTLIICHLFILKTLRLDSFCGETYYKGAGVFTAIVDYKTKIKKFTLTRHKTYNTAVTTSVTVFCVVAGILLGTNAILNAINYQRADRVKQMRSNLIQATEEFDYEHPFESLETYIKAFKNEDLPSYEPSGISHDGVLGDNGSIRFSKIDIMDITSNRIKTSVYLKGKSYGDYNGKGWEEIKPKYAGKVYPQQFFGEWILEYSDLINKPDISLPYSGTKYEVLDNAHIKIDFLSRKTVKNGITYAPYFSTDLNYNSDIGYKADNPQSFETKICQNNGLYEALYFDYKEYENTMRLYYGDSLVETYNYLENSFPRLRSENQMYRENVKKYLELPNTPAIERIRNELYKSPYFTMRIGELYSGEFDPANGSFADSESIIGDYDENIKSKLYVIKNFIQHDTYYSLNAGVTPKTEDFVEYFLFTQKKGSCSYYASAGTVLCRMLGIPARYCEGYVIFPSDYEKSTEYVNYSSTNTEYRKFTLKDERAHAWTEVYVDGLGWIPFEFTPGYDVNKAYAENPPEPPVTTSNAVTTSVTSGTRTSQSQTGTGITTSKNVTTTKATTATVTTTSAKDENKTLNINIDVIFWTLIALLVIAVILLPYLRYLKNCSKYKDAPYDINGKALHYYSYIVDLLAYFGHTRGNRMYKEYSEHIEDISDFWNGEFIKATETAEKAKFDEVKISDEEAEFIKMLAQKYFKDVYNNSKLFKKISLKYLGYGVIAEI